MATTIENPIDATRCNSILNSRLPITKSIIGQQVILSVQGSPSFLSAKEQELKTPGQKQYFDKYIVNAKANSSEAMSRRENKMVLSAALNQEAAGNTDAAHGLFSDYLNHVQVSFNVIVRAGNHQFADGEMFTATVVEVDTKAGYRALSLDSVKYKAPVSIEKVKFSIVDLIGEEVFTQAEMDALVKS